MDSSRNDAAVMPARAFSKSLRRYRKERSKNLRKKLPVVAAKLRTLGVEAVHVHYDGCGDSGQIESIEYFDDYGTEVWAEWLDEEERELTDLFYDLTQERDVGWENNEGACGTFVWILDGMALQHEHNVRYMSVEISHWEGL